MIRIVVAIGWLYVVVLMAATQDSWLAAFGTLVFYGALPLAIILYVLGAPVRARRRRAAAGRDVSSAISSQPEPAQAREASRMRDPD